MEAKLAVQKFIEKRKEKQLAAAAANLQMMSNEGFIEACKAADVEPTKRQASKWRHRRGKAYKLKHGLI